MKRHFRASLRCLSNFYQELSVKPSASDAEIKKAYFALAKKWHPDLNSAGEARAKFEKIAQAYETLGDEAQRDAYDEKNGFKS